MQTQTIKNNKWWYKVIIKPDVARDDWQTISKSIQFGLYVLGTEKHESRRIDNQLRWRSGRQGDSGVTQFFVALDDEIMRKMWGDKIQSAARMILPEAELADLELTQSQFTDSIIWSQKQMEAYHFGVRKHLFDYDSVINKQRIKIYKLRDQILEDKIDIQNHIKWLIAELVAYHIDKYTKTQESSESFFDSINQIFATNIPNIQSKDTSSIQDHILSYLIERFDHITGQLDQEKRDFICKYIYLDNIDKYWINHIDDMQHLREKVGLYGYAQQDPVIMYKQEWYLLFETMQNNIATDTLANIYRIDPNHINNLNIWQNNLANISTNSEEFETDNHDIYSIENPSDNKNVINTNDIQIIQASDYQKTSVTTINIPKREPRPNDKVTVAYTDGRIMSDVKFKKIEEDFKNWLCKIL